MCLKENRKLNIWCLPKLKWLYVDNAIGEKNKLETAILGYLDKIPAKKRFAYLLREWGMTDLWVTDLWVTDL